MITIIIIFVLNQSCHKTQKCRATFVRHFMLHCNWKVQINFFHRQELWRNATVQVWSVCICPKKLKQELSPTKKNNNTDSDNVNTL